MTIAMRVQRLALNCFGMMVLVSLGFQIMLAQTLKYNPGDELRFGIGYNTLTGQYAGNCTKDVMPEDIKPAGSDEPDPGQLTRYELSNVQELSSLAEKLDFSASASASFVAGSVSVSAQYVRTHAFNSFHQFLYLDATVANATKIWTKPELTVPMLALRQKNPLEFLNRCGDTFVKTITEGGELTAVLDISTTAQEDTSSLDIAISGNYGTAEGKAALKTQLQATLLNRQTKVNMMRAGGTKNLPSYSADDLIAASLTFPDTVQQHPYPMFAKLASYNTIANGLSLTAAQESFIAPLFRVYQRAMQYSGDLVYLRSHTFEFRILGIPKVPGAVSVMATKAPTTSNLDEWKAYGIARAADPDVQFSILEGNAQKVVSGDFTFNDIDKEEVDGTINNWNGLVDNLTALARRCLNDPKNGCSGAVPQEPARIQHLVRIFPLAPTWDTSTGPVSISLDSSYVCKVEYILGNWRIADAASAPVLACNNSLPHQVTNGHIITGNFDSIYSDNHGVCTYQLMCYRR